MRATCLAIFFFCSQIATIRLIIQNVPGGKVSILRGRSICHSKQKNVYVYVLFRTVSEMELVYCTDDQHARSSHELQSALMLTVEFSKNVSDSVNCTNFVT
jgi:hypothetical protein